ncbi:MAG: alpha/beta fold hydrolase, partial [Clostridium sp.]
MKRILIHGLGQNSLVWNETISHMLIQDNIFCVELATLIKGKEVSYQNLYKAFSNYCNEISEPLDLCGLSLGAVLALNYAIDNPKRVNSLVLIAAQYEMPKTLLKLQNIVFRFIPKKSFESMGMSREDFIKLTKSMM